MPSLFIFPLTISILIPVSLLPFPLLPSPLLSLFSSYFCFCLSYNFKECFSCYMQYFTGFSKRLFCGNYYCYYLSGLTITDHQITNLIYKFLFIYYPHIQYLMSSINVHMYMNVMIKMAILSFAPFLGSGQVMRLVNEGQQRGFQSWFYYLSFWLSVSKFFLNGESSALPIKYFLGT